MPQLPTIASGTWKRNAFMTDYRAELLDELLVERATWTNDAPEQLIGGTAVAQGGFVWFRFWLADGEQVIEKYFNQQRQPIGYFMPISSNWRRRDNQWSAADLLLTLWLDVSGQLTVLGEDRFENAVNHATLTPVESDHAEQRIRRLTLMIAQKRFPPPLVRNFAI